MFNDLTFFFGATTALLGFYIYKYHSRHFVEICLDQYLLTKFKIEDMTEHVKKTLSINPNNSDQNNSNDQIEIKQVCYIDPKTSTIHPLIDIKNVFDRTREGELVHIIYSYQKQNYRIVTELKSDLGEYLKIGDLLSRSDWIKDGVEIGIDEIQYSQNQPSEQLLMEYAGPLKDFHKSIDLEPHYLGLLDQDGSNFLLKKDDQITISTSLGDEYSFSRFN